MRLSSTDRTVDLERRLVDHEDGRTEGPTPFETNLLHRLLHAGRELVTRRELLVDVWGYSPTVATRAVDDTVRRLRRKPEDSG